MKNPKNIFLLLAFAGIVSCTQIVEFGSGVKTSVNSLALSEKDEPDLGQSVGVVFTTQFGLDDDRALEKYVTLVGLTVAGASDRPDRNYVFGVLDTENVNAYSGPDGYIFVTKGLLRYVNDEAELAGILGHEIAHVCHHDGLHQVKDAELNKGVGQITKAGEEIGNQALQTAQKVSNSDKVKALAARVDLTSFVLTVKGYSPDQEFNADLDGVKYTSAAGYDPNHFLNFLKRLKDLQSSGKPLMKTHPALDERITRVTDEINGMAQIGHAGLAERFAANVKLPAPTTQAGS